MYLIVEVLCTNIEKNLLSKMLNMYINEKGHDKWRTCR